MTRFTEKAKLEPVGSNVVRVSLPAEVAYDLKSFQRVQKDILRRLNCDACCSGWDIRFDILRSFSVDKNLKIRETAGFDVGNG